MSQSPRSLSARWLWRPVKTLPESHKRGCYYLEIYNIHYQPWIIKERTTSCSAPSRWLQQLTKSILMPDTFDPDRLISWRHSSTCTQYVQTFSPEGQWFHIYDSPNGNNELGLAAVWYFNPALTPLQVTSPAFSSHPYPHQPPHCFCCAAASVPSIWHFANSVLIPLMQIPPFLFLLIAWKRLCVVVTVALQQRRSVVLNCWSLRTPFFFSW